MKYTKNLRLPIFDKPETDLFKISEWNEGNESIDRTYENVMNVTEELKNKTDLLGDHKGSWQGITNPVYSEPGIANVVIDNTKNLKDLKEEVNKRELLFKGSYTSLRDLLENCPNVSERGGVIYLPSGIIEMEPFTIGDRITLRGCGTGSTILKQKANTKGDFITIENNNNFITICDLTIDGNKSNFTDGNGIVVKTCPQWDNHDSLLPTKKAKVIDTYSHLYINNVIVINNKRNGIHVELINFAINISNVHCRLNDLNGILNESTDNFFSNLYLEKNGVSGLCEKGKNNKWSVVKSIWNGNLDNTKGGVYVRGGANKFISVESQDNYTHGFFIEGGANNFICCLSDSNGYKTYDESTNAHYGFYFKDCYENITTSCVVANYREKPFHKKPFVVEGVSRLNKIDIKVTTNSCIDMNGEYGKDTYGTININDPDRKYTIDNMGIRTINRNCYFEVTNGEVMTKIFDLPINFLTTLSCHSEVSGINSGELNAHCYKLHHHAEVIENELGIKQLRVTTRNDSTIAGVWAIYILVTVKGF